LDSYISEQIRYNSLSHRLSKLENKEFDEFMKIDEDKKKPTTVEIDHEAQMREAMRL
jgi:hypothetical protein